VTDEIKRLVGDALDAAFGPHPSEDRPYRAEALNDALSSVGLVIEKRTNS